MSYNQNSQPIEIILNVYDLNLKTNGHPLIKLTGLGFYHSGIEINGTEYAYGGNESNPGTGVFAAPPLSAEVEGVTYKESFLLGSVKNASRVNDVLDEVKRQFIANEYNLITRNCNHFCEAFTMQLLDKKLPSYVNKAANLGHYFSCFLPNSVKGINPVPSGGGQSNMNNTRASTTDLSQTSDLLNNSSRGAFSGKGYTISDYDQLEQNSERT